MGTAGTKPKSSQHPVEQTPHITGCCVVPVSPPSEHPLIILSPSKRPSSSPHVRLWVPRNSLILGSQSLQADFRAAVLLSAAGPISRVRNDALRYLTTQVSPRYLPTLDRTAGKYVIYVPENGSHWDEMTSDSDGPGPENGHGRGRHHKTHKLRETCRPTGMPGSVLLIFCILTYQ